MIYAGLSVPARGASGRVIFSQERRDFFQEVDLILGFGETVSLALVDIIFGRMAKLGQGVDQLLRLSGRNGRIDIAMRDQDRDFEVGGAFGRRNRIERGAVFALDAVTPVAKITRREERFTVVFAYLSCAAMSDTPAKLIAQR